MYTVAKIKDHPIHPMLVAFPIAFYTSAFVTFFIYQFFSSDVFWFKVGYLANDAGVVMAILAAVPGFIDWAVGIPKTSAANPRGLVHMTLNVLALIFFIANAFTLNGTWNAPLIDVTGLWICALIGVILTMAAAYHGWELIATHKVGVTMTPKQENIEPVEKLDRRDHKIDFPHKVG